MNKTIRNAQHREPVGPVPTSEEGNVSTLAIHLFLSALAAVGVAGGVVFLANEQPAPLVGRVFDAIAGAGTLGNAALFAINFGEFLKGVRRELEAESEDQS